MAANSEGPGVTDTITFSVTGAIQLASALPALTSPVDIQGPGASSLTIEPASGVSTNIFTVDSGVTANISGLTMANGNESGITNAGTLNVDSCVISGNSVFGVSGNSNAQPPTNGTGGGINNTGTLQLTHCTVSNNTATGGTGVSSAGVFLAGAQGLGGGIYDNGGSVTIVDSTLSGNRALGGASTGFDLTQAANGGNGLGGGLYATGSGINTGIVIHNSTFGNNQALGGAGGNGASSSPNGAVTAGNGGNGLGGGTYMDGSAGLGMTSATIADNSSSGGPSGTGGPSGPSPGTGSAGGIDDASSADVQIEDTIVGDNTATTSAPDLSGAIFSRGYNLLKNTTGWTGQPSGSDLTGVDPVLGPLANNGGPTQTFALKPGSPAYNAGNPNYSATGFDATDQRGFTRIVDGRVDIGAYEVQNNGPATLVVTTTADSGPGSLRQAITEANFAAGATDTITFTVTGIIQLASALPILTNPVNIDGPGSASLTIEPNSGVLIRIFTINSGVAANISGLTMANANESANFGQPGQGGAIYNAGTLSLDHCVITNSTVTGSFGQVAVLPTDAQGAGIYNAGTLVLTHSTVSSNQATGGGGFSKTGELESGATGLGGGIYSNGGSVTIVDSTLSGNQALGGRAGGVDINVAGNGGNAVGGGLYITGGAQVAIYNSTLSGNEAIGAVGAAGSANPNFPATPGNGGNALGGAVYVDTGTLTITSGTIAGNSALGGQGGTGGPSAHPNGNPGTGSVGGIDNAGGTVTIADTIVANYAATNPDVQGTIHTNGYNLVKQPNGGTFIGNAAADIYGVDPRLGPLENNGGPTQTRALLAGSPAINAGDPNYSATGFNATDERGFPRIVDGRVDIGAYEVQSNEPPTGSSIAAAGPTVVFAVTASGGLEVYQNGTWTAIGGNGTISSVSAVTDIHGNATVFAVTADHALAEWSQSSGWHMLGAPGTIWLASAGLDPNGLADVYVITSADELTGWSTSGGWLPSPIGARGTIGSRSVADAGSFSAANAGTVYVATNAQVVDEYGPQTGWVQLPSPGQGVGLSVVSAESSSSGQTVLFAVEGNYSPYSYSPQTGWATVGASISNTISAGSTASGQADVFALTSLGQPEFAMYSAATGWKAIGAPGTIAQFDATTSDYVFVVTTGQSIASYSDQTGWMSLTGPGFGVG